MRVLLINPLTEKDGIRFNVPRDAISGEAATGVVYPPLELASAAAYLRVRGIEVDLIDACALDMRDAQVALYAAATCPDFILVPSSRYTAYQDLVLGSLLKSKCPNTQILVSGNNATMMPHHYLPQFDGVVLGELESGLWNFISGERSENVAYIGESGRMTVRSRRLIADLSELPLPARDLLPNERYRTHYISRNPFTWVLSQRGCPAQCNFCEIQVWGMRKVRYRPVESVVEELKEIRNRYGIPYVMFRDGDFCSSRNRTLELCEAISRKELDLTWKCMARADNVDAEVLAAMRRAGCELVSYGFEAAEKASLDRLQKGHYRDATERAVALTREAGIETLGFFMLGVPGETEQSANATIALATSLDLDYAEFTLYTPLRDPEDPEYYELECGDGFAGPMRTPLGIGMTAERVVELGAKAYLRFYARPSYVWRRIRRLRDWRDFLMKCRGVLELLKFAVTRLPYLRGQMRVSSSRKSLYAADHAPSNMHVHPEEVVAQRLPRR